MIKAEPRVLGNLELIDLVESVSPREKVLEKLPQFYKNLFSGRSSINEDFWIRRHRDEEMFGTAVMRHHAGYRGGILIIGERNSGKTTFCQNMAERFFKGDHVNHLFPVPKGSSRIPDFVAEVEKVIHTQGSIEEIIGSIPPESVLIIHDLELWWERSTQGWDVVRLLMTMINDYSGKVLFVINMNPYAFNLMNKMVRLQESFISIIPLRPFGAMELKEMIICRHRSSGLKFVLNKTDEEEVSEIRMANLFNAYFDYSEGNPGTAFCAWLANITDVSGQKIYIRPPRLPDTRLLREMDENWKLLLIQIILHKRMDFNKIARMFLWDDARTKQTIGSLERVHLIEERNENLYIVNSFLEPHIIRIFEREGLL